MAEKKPTKAKSDETVKKEKVAKHPKGSFRSTRKGKHIVCGVVWAPGESKKVPDTMKKEKAFNLACKLGHLVENE